MNYDGLDKAYWEAQIQRVVQLREKIVARATVPLGRVIPDDADLAIGTGRRLSLTVMFVDISGFSQRKSSTPQEQEMMLRVLNLFMTEMIRIVEDYGGNVEKNTGDGLMAYFEDEPGRTGANSTKRAVSCALTMHAANEHLIAPILRATPVAPIDFRVTMDHGPVTIARIGAAQRFNANVAIGNTANFASHMLAQVKAGQIALGASAQSRLPEVWRTLWTELSPVATGWVFGDSTVPYPLYIYTGRWARLT
jgi:adenylate cyclase